MVATRESIETRLRDLYAAFARGDMAAVLAHCTDEITFHVPGSAPFSGDQTKATFGEWIGKVIDLSGGTFREDILDVMTGDDHGAVLLHHTLQRDGKPAEYTVIHLWKAAGDKFSEWWEYPQDLDAFNRAWA